LALLQRALQPVELPLTTVLEEASVPIEAIYFIESGFASVVTGNKPPVEIGWSGAKA
jgi:hypothetical protein